MIKARELTVSAVMEALQSGCHYSSCGPEIKDFRIADGKATVECSPALEIHFMSQRSNGRSIYATDGKSLTYAERELNDGLNYIRAEIVDAKGKRAWTNPVVLNNGG